MKITRRTLETFTLELAMRDVLGNLEEFSLHAGYDFPHDCMEILAIEAPQSGQPEETAAILEFPRLQRSA